ncbi:MAG: penicillin-binding protein activator [Novosphingobium sp. 17-62-19]|uniref:penicillin-binding protein activator n=1 Tax=Novosphingobium sp. 17-62-19 TaxID=1970406 RepID=UPI000BCA19BF|nr:penicillin-binding protein activator [Novosphingobium sp. 17-62-19]OZA19897.1 MAG: penicillin-binding protein activator [Novosphingobium sp. 17-62-19]HQS98245.1 penicillin-binding protein activator [Novosphingobium sp.]
MIDMHNGEQALSGFRQSRRWAVIGALSLLAGCAVIPKGSVPVTEPTEKAPDADVLPTDAGRHRVALLVPMTGANAAVGQSIANAATMALLDTNAANLRITTYDTATGAGTAAARAISDGNKLILGPLLADDVTQVSNVARTSRVPMITYSNDSAVASRDVFVMGQAPGQSIARVLGFAKSRGIKSVAAIIPTGDYGQRSTAGLTEAARAQGIAVTSIETYDRGNTSVASAVRRAKEKGKFDALLIADGSRIALQAAPLAGKGIKLLGTELWSGDGTIAKAPAMRGAWFATVSDQRFGQFEKSYTSRFGATPSRLATLGYDSVLLTLNVARGWKPGTTFPTAKLFDPQGFIGLDGVFRFTATGMAERAMEVREVGAGTFATASPAPAKF